MQCLHILIFMNAKAQTVTSHQLLQAWPTKSTNMKGMERQHQNTNMCHNNKNVLTEILPAFIIKGKNARIDSISVFTIKKERY